jgi:glycosyltransferase involved in cell wall biosynthesis
VRILFFANTDWYLYNFRLDLAEALRAGGHEVILISPEGNYVQGLQSRGFRWVKFPLSRRGLNPLSEALAVIRLAWLYRRERPDLVQHFTIKCVLYGSLAARLTGTRKVINSVTGLGYVFMESRGVRGSLQSLARLLYRYTLQKTTVIFQNPDDLSAFLKDGLVRPEQAYLIRGSGVDLKRFTPRPEPAGEPLIIFPGRLLWDKGVGEFVEAARLLKARGLQARFVLVGEGDPDNPSGIPADTIQDWIETGVVESWGWRDDMPDVYAQASIVCFPSYYKEGVPKALLEAAASGRAIVTADVPGCREVVRDGINGLLVPPRDPRALAEALAKLAAEPVLRDEMGRQGRLIVEAEFSSEYVIQQSLELYNALMVRSL